MGKITLSTKVDDLRTEGFAERRDLEHSERVSRAARIFGILFGVGLVSVLVPVLHLILPPLFLIAGMIFATTTYMETAEILSGEVTCPNCHRVMALRPEAEEWPKSLRCEGCSYTLTVEPAAG